MHIWLRHVCTLVVDVFFKDLHIWMRNVAQMWLFAHWRVKCLHKCGWFLMKTMICTFVGCLHISRKNLTFAHLTASCLHISGWCIFLIFFITDLHIWGRRVCTNVVVCTFEGKMFAQMWLFAILWFLHISRLHRGIQIFARISYPCPQVEYIWAMHLCRTWGGGGWRRRILHFWSDCL